MDVGLPETTRFIVKALRPWLMLVISPLWIEKLCQLMMARWERLLMSSLAEFIPWKLTLPATTFAPCGFAPTRTG